MPYALYRQGTQELSFAKKKKKNWKQSQLLLNKVLWLKYTMGLHNIICLLGMNLMSNNVVSPSHSLKETEE